MKVIVAGSRNGFVARNVFEALEVRIVAYTLIVVFAVGMVSLFSGRRWVDVWDQRLARIFGTYIFENLQNVAIAFTVKFRLRLSWIMLLASIVAIVAVILGVL